MLTAPPDSDLVRLARLVADAGYEFVHPDASDDRPRECAGWDRVGA